MSWPDRAHIHGDGPWRFTEGVRDGHPIVMRVNVGLSVVAGHPDYPLQVGIAVPLHQPRENGMPGSMEANDLRRIEEALFLDFLQGNESLFAAVITTNGMREFVFYTSNDAELRRKLDELREIFPDHELQLMIRPDPKWNVFRQLAGEK